MQNATITLRHEDFLNLQRLAKYAIDLDITTDDAFNDFKSKEFKIIETLKDENARLMDDYKSQRHESMEHKENETKTLVFVHDFRRELEQLGNVEILRSFDEKYQNRYGYGEIN